MRWRGSRDKKPPRFSTTNPSQLTEGNENRETRDHRQRGNDENLDDV